MANPRVKRTSWLLLALIGLFVFSAWYLMLEQEELNPLSLVGDVEEVVKRVPRGLAPEEDLDNYFTVVMITYRRMDLYKVALEHYCNIPEVDQVLLLWNNLNHTEYPLPDPSSFNCAAPVRVLPQTENQVSNRMYQAPNVRTKAVFQVDDDFIVKRDAVRLGFHIWKGDPDRIVGYVVRNHLQRDGKWTYDFFIGDGFSIVIGASMFIDKRFYELYTSDHPIINKIREYVREKSCCDDIAMNSIVSHKTHKGPIYIETKHQTIHSQLPDGFQGKSHQPNWGDKRSTAVQDMVDFWGSVPFVTSQTIVTSTAKHFSWKYRFRHSLHEFFRNF